MKKMTSAASLAAIALLALTACGGSSDSTSVASETSATASSSAAGNLEITDTWIKATDGSMTGVFGKLTNTGDEPITIVKADSTVAAMNQLHTTEMDATTGSSAMKEVDSFVIEPGATFELEPGGNHIMLMEMKCSLPAGTETSLTLTDSENQTYQLTAQARDYTGAKEEYAPGEEASEHAGHDMHSQTSAVALPECS